MALACALVTLGMLGQEHSGRRSQQMTQPAGLRHSVCMKILPVA